MKKTILSIGSAIYSILSNDEDIIKKINNKSHIYPIVAPLDTTFPFIVYSRSSNVDNNKDIRGDVATVNIMCISDRYEESVEIAEIIRNKFKILNSEINDILIFKIELVRTNEDYRNDAYIQELSFNVYAKI